MSGKTGSGLYSTTFTPDFQGYGQSSPTVLSSLGSDLFTPVVQFVSMWKLFEIKSRDELLVDMSNQVGKGATCTVMSGMFRGIQCAVKVSRSKLQIRGSSHHETIASSPRHHIFHTRKSLRSDSTSRMIQTGSGRSV